VVRHVDEIVEDLLARAGDLRLHGERLHRGAQSSARGRKFCAVFGGRSVVI
jgi:hypothetical protein